jgi:transcription-repair coupling factor (superfamily II helicase)
MAVLSKLSLLDYLSEDRQLENLNKAKDARVSSPEALAVLAGISFNKRPRKMFFLFPTIYEAENFSQFLGDYVKEEESYIFPYDEIFRTSAIGVSPEMKEERLLAMSSIVREKPSILVAHMSSAMLNIMSPERYLRHIIDLKKDDMINLKELIENIERLGYMPADHVTTGSQFSLRGGILDIYDSAYPNPVRLEFFGDEIDDLRFFHVNDELSFEHINEIEIHPASLQLLNDDEIEQGKERINQELLTIGKRDDIDRLAYDDLLQRMTELLVSSKSKFLSDIDARFYGIFNGDDASLLDYLSDYESYIYDPQNLKTVSTEVLKKEKDYFKKACKDGASLNGEKVYINKKLSLSEFHES